MICGERTLNKKIYQQANKDFQARHREQGSI